MGIGGSGPQSLKAAEKQQIFITIWPVYHFFSNANSIAANRNSLYIISFASAILLMPETSCTFLLSRPLPLLQTLFINVQALQTCNSTVNWNIFLHSGSLAGAPLGELRVLGYFNTCPNQ